MKLEYIINKLENVGLLNFNEIRKDKIAIMIDGNYEKTMNKLEEAGLDDLIINYMEEPIILKYE